MDLLNASRIQRNQMAGQRQHSKHQNSIGITKMHTVDPYRKLGSLDQFCVRSASALDEGSLVFDQITQWGIESVEFYGAFLVLHAYSMNTPRSTLLVSVHNLVLNYSYLHLFSMWGKPLGFDYSFFIMVELSSIWTSVIYYGDSQTITFMGTLHPNLMTQGLTGTWDLGT